MNAQHRGRSTPQATLSPTAAACLEERLLAIGDDIPDGAPPKKRRPTDLALTTSRHYSTDTGDVATSRLVIPGYQ